MPHIPPPLTLATWNIEHLRAQDDVGPVKRDAADFARLHTYATRLNADIIALQEVDSAEALARVFDPSEYDFHVSSRNNSQRTGFAYRKSLRVEKNPDFTALDVGGVRHGADLTVYLGETPLRLLAVHLKSGCFDASLSSTSRACEKLKLQIPILEEWIDARANEGTPFIVLGDFNRRFFKASGEGDEVWQELDDSEPSLADLSAPTMGQRSACWAGKFPDYIDHILLGRTASDWLISGSFRQLVYDAGEEQDGLSDHCPIAVTLGGNTGGPAVPPRPEPPKPVETASLVKGNVNSRGAKLYHLPGCPSYPNVKIDSRKGEQLFTSEAEAIAAGFTKAGNCP